MFIIEPRYVSSATHSSGSAADSVIEKKDVGRTASN